jgi:hypothetical protein
MQKRQRKSMPDKTARMQRPPSGGHLNEMPGRFITELLRNSAYARLKAGATPNHKIIGAIE